jgi:hypothetical protein
MTFVLTQLTVCTQRALTNLVLDPAMVDRESWRISLAAIESLLVGRPVFPAEEPMPPQQVQMPPTRQQAPKSSFRSSALEAVGLSSQLQTTQPVVARGGSAAVEPVFDGRQAIDHPPSGSKKFPVDGLVLPQQVPAAARCQPGPQATPRDPPQNVASEVRPQSSRLDSEKAKRIVMHLLPRQSGELHEHTESPVSATLQADRVVPSSRVSSAPALRGRGRGAGNASRTQGT